MPNIKTSSISENELFKQLVEANKKIEKLLVLVANKDETILNLKKELEKMRTELDEALKTKDQSEKTKEKLSEEVLLLAYDQFVSGRKTRSKNKKEPDES